MITEEQAYHRILAATNPLSARRIALTDAANCFAAEDSFAKTPLPNFDNSAMDGYAVRVSDCARDKSLEVIGEQPAGVDRQLRISSGEAIRIFTGAPIPDGADAVVMQEDVTLGGSEISINTDVQSGDFIRRRGCDLAEGQKIVSKGQRLRVTAMAALAAQGLSEVAVGGRVTAAVVSTGDEVVQPGVSLRRGEIYDSNTVLLKTLLAGWDAEVRFAEHSPDDEQALIGCLRRAADNNVLLISGGVSVGQHDLVKSALAAIGATIDVWRVAIKPGKPFLFGKAGACHVFGLPGNPVSSFVTFLKFVRPAVLRMMGAADNELPLRAVTAHLTEDVVSDSDRPHYIRGRLCDGKFNTSGRQESHALFGLSQSNALLRVPAQTTFRAGEFVQVELWD